MVGDQTTRGQFCQAEELKCSLGSGLFFLKMTLAERVNKLSLEQKDWIQKALRRQIWQGGGPS